MIYKGLNGTVESIVYNPLYNTVMGAGSHGDILMWDVRSGAIQMNLQGHKSAVTALSLPGNHQLVSSGLDKIVKIWDLQTGDSISTSEHSSRITCIEGDLCTGLLFTGSADHQIRIFNLHDGKQVQTLHGHIAAIRHIITDKKNNQVISCADEGEIIVWDYSEPGDMKIKSKLYLQYSVTCMSLLPHDLVCTGTINGGLSFFKKCHE